MQSSFPHRTDMLASTLWNGTNSSGKQVYSWIANETLTDLNMDFAPLLGFLAREESISEDVYLGTIQFGHETFSAASQMNFSISSYAAEIQSNSAAPNSTAESLPVATTVSFAPRVARFKSRLASLLWLSCVLVLTWC